jgi:hypothetical protein
MIKKFFALFGVDIKRKARIKWNCWPVQKENHIVFFEEDFDFHLAYDKAQIATQMQLSDNPLRRQRHYTLVQYNTP